MNEARQATRLQAERFDDALDELEKAAPFARVSYQTRLFQVAETLMNGDDGLEQLYRRAPRFPEAGVFAGGPWEDPARLQPTLVAGSLLGSGVYPIVETLSELRCVALATGTMVDERMSASDARAFLEQTMALNLEWLFPKATEASRIEGTVQRERNIRLFRFIAERVGLQNLRDNVIDEIEQVAAQRPIQTEPLRRMVRLATQIPMGWRSERDRLAPYASAISKASPLSKRLPDLAEYRNRLRRITRRALEAEAKAFSLSMEHTGLVCSHHAVLVRHLRQVPEILPLALGLTDAGRADFADRSQDVINLIGASIYPATCQAVYGLSRVLNRRLLSRNEIRAGLDRLVTLDLQPEVRARLLEGFDGTDVPSPNAVLLAGAIQVFGSPLGIGQGNNPTCQAARGLSLWAQHAQGFLLEVLVSAARDGFVEVSFEGQSMRSDLAKGGVATSIDYDLDAVSKVVVGHLDRLYDEMMRRVSLRHEDGHKWVNPELYGRWVPRGFASVFVDRAQTTVSNFDAFVRRFYATHHPEYNDGHQLMYPNPVGICVTNSLGFFLGAHAVSVQRVAMDPEGVLRVYFYNPNNEGRQDWGHGVVPSIHERGEIEGESSLPFEQFVARLYAFHYNPYEEGDAFAVPAEVVAGIHAEARDTWGRAFEWRS